MRSRRRTARVVLDDGVHHIHGPLSFLSADGVFTSLPAEQPTVAVSLRHVSYMDVTGAKALLAFIDRAHIAGIELRIEDLPTHVEQLLAAVADHEQHGRLTAAVQTP
ncbi:STAS domain-containing protein [Nocardia crassostreae]|uniref:STAS domain-containing protein n=1 Tax=Nocardia crassostreae TaxID=53428 RepID=UPI00350E3631